MRPVVQNMEEEQKVEVAVKVHEENQIEVEQVVILDAPGRQSENNNVL